LGGACSGDRRTFDRTLQRLPLTAMSLQISAAQAELIARAFTTGAETSVAQLADLLGLAGEGKLIAARQVVDFVCGLNLELVPSPDEEEFDSVRVLRVRKPVGDSVSEVLNLLTQGEGPSIEFKSSMLCSMREWEKSATRVEYPSLVGEILKTVCAFLNSDGGDLLVGVSDDAEVCAGVRLDLELKNWSHDKWELHFQSLVSARFYDGQQIQPYLRTRMIQVNSEAVFHVKVMGRARPSFVQREKGQAFEFYIRNGPRTDALDLPAFYSHVVATTG
jgi:Schlafen, AlbA_2